MAYGLGYAGGYADATGTYGDYEGGYTEGGAQPQPTPPAVGGGAPLVRRRWLPRQTQPWPPPLPVRVRVRITVTYRWAANVVSVRPQARMRTHQPRMGLEVKAVTVHPAGRRIANRMEVKNVTLTVDPIAQSRHAWEMRELNEIVVALAALE